MLRGQIYYYIKQIDAFYESHTREDLLRLEILGVDVASLADIEELSIQSAARIIKDYFSSRYQGVLKQHNLIFAYEFWMALSTPRHVRISQKPGSAYQEKLRQWVADGLNPDQFEDIIREGALQAEQEDVALYYGLKVLWVLDRVILQEKPVSDEKETSPDQTQYDSPEKISDDPQILVVSEEYFAPLFVNLNCHHISKVTSKQAQFEHVQQALRMYPHIQLVLVQDDAEDLVPYLRKQLPSNILVTSVPMDSSDSEGYFDMIVSKTLGVKLARVEA